MHSSLALNSSSARNFIARLLMIVALLMPSGVLMQLSAADARPWDKPVTIDNGDSDNSAKQMTDSLGKQTQGLAQWIFGPLMWVVVGLVILVVIVGIATGSAKVALYGILAVFIGVFLITAVSRFLSP